MIPTLRNIAKNDLINIYQVFLKHTVADYSNIPLRNAYYQLVAEIAYRYHYGMM